MIEADSKVNIFEKYNVSTLLEMMFLSVLKEYERQGIGLELCRLSLDVAYSRNIRLVSCLLTGEYSQSIGRKLGFEVIHEESFNNYSFNGKTFAERNFLHNLKSKLCVKTITRKPDNSLHLNFN
jgi:predicted N-acetyltransferase YhbS